MTIFDTEKRIGQAEEQFKSLSEYVTGEAQDQDAYTVEKRVFNTTTLKCPQVSRDLWR